MTGLADAVYRMMTGDDPAHAASWAEQLVSMRERAGSGRALARELGVNESTVRRMLSGQTRAPKASTLEAVRSRRIDPDRLAESAVRLHTTDRDSGRERTLTDDNLKLTPGTMRRVADAYIRTGDPEAAAAAFLKGVTVPWYRNYLKPRDGQPSRAESASTRGGGGGAGEGDDYGPGDVDQGDGLEDVEDYPEWYDDLAYEDTYGPDDGDYGADVA